jgi:hypothetical protein
MKLYVILDYAINTCKNCSEEFLYNLYFVGVDDIYSP